jgi:cell division protein FtsB
MLQAVKAILLPATLGVVILYFSYHALAGDQGLAKWTQLQAQENELQRQLVELTAERDALDKELNRLRDDSIDLDYVEEVARTKLSYVRPDELLIAVR